MLRQMEVLMKKLAPLAAGVPAQPGNADVRNPVSGIRHPASGIPHPPQRSAA
jgi:hypothetical protein